MKILLTGAAGQIGREIVDAARKHSVDIVALSKKELDITQPDQVQNIFKKYCFFDVVINSAAYTAVDLAEINGFIAYAVNRDGVKHLAESCVEYNIPIIHLSTDYVFSGERVSPYKEDDISHPLNVYGKSKREGEEILQNTLDRYVVIRTSWVFGKYGNNFVKTILQCAKEQRGLNIIEDQYGCPTASADIARVILRIANRIYAGDGCWGIYHYCNQPVTNWYNFAKEIIEIGRKQYSLKIERLNKIKTKDYPAKALRPRYSELCTDKIKKDYGIDSENWATYLKMLVKEIGL